MAVSQESLDVLNKLSSLLDVKMDWNNNDGLVLNNENIGEINISYAPEEDILLMYSKVGNLGVLSDEAREKYIKDILERNLFGGDFYGSSIGVDKEENIVFSNSIRSVKNFSSSAITEDFVKGFFSSLSNEKNLFSAAVK